MPSFIVGVLLGALLGATVRCPCIAISSVNTDLGYLNAFALLGTNKILGAGTIYSGGGYDFALVRFNELGFLSVSQQNNDLTGGGGGSLSLFFLLIMAGLRKLLGINN